MVIDCGIGYVPAGGNSETVKDARIVIVAVFIVPVFPKLSFAKYFSVVVELIEIGAE